VTHFRGEVLLDRIAVAVTGKVLIGLVLVAAPNNASGDCASPSLSSRASIDVLIEHVEREGIRRVFVGERHDVGPVKRFAADLANALVDRGWDVGLYVEGFRTDCGTAGSPCRDIAGLFNAAAFERLVELSRAPVHPLDPPGRDRRVSEMVGRLAYGQESVQVVLVGRSHVAYAGQPDAKLYVYGGAVRYADPGDLVEAFPRRESLTVTLEVTPSGRVSEGSGDASTAVYPIAPYQIVTDGCVADYRLFAPDRLAY